MRCQLLGGERGERTLCQASEECPRQHTPAINDSNAGPDLHREEEIPLTSVGGVASLIDELSRRRSSSADAILLPYTLSLADKAQGEELLRQALRILVDEGLLIAINADLAAIAAEVGRGAGLNDTLFSGSAMSHAIYMSTYKLREDSADATGGFAPYKDQGSPDENGELVGAGGREEAVSSQRVLVFGARAENLRRP